MSTFHTPRTDEEMKCTPRQGVSVVEAHHAKVLERELNVMASVLRRIVDCGGIGSEEMFDDARTVLAEYDHEVTKAKGGAK